MPRIVGPGTQLSVDLLLDRARARSGLSDFGDRWFLEPLAALVELINAEAALESDDTPGVRLMVRYLADRLMLVDYVKRHPDVLDEQVEVRGVIVGHARGGSTLTHGLLTASDQFTWCRLWELEYPVPLPGEERGDSRRRLALADDIARAFMEQAPEYASIHPLDMRDPGEEVLLMDRGFLTMLYNCYFNMPSVPRWLLTQDHQRSYRELRLWLQLLQHQDPSRRGRAWLLKANTHLMSGAVSALLDEFPETKAIMSHRHLASVIGSFASSWVPYLRIYAPGVDDSTLGRRLADWFEAALAALDAARERHPGRIVDLDYRDTVDDPIGQYRRTVERLGVPARARDIDAATAWMDAHPRSSHPPHRYRLEDYGLTADAIESRFADYHARFVG